LFREQTVSQPQAGCIAVWGGKPLPVGAVAIVEA
jgi:hypothetical protein